MKYHQALKVAKAAGEEVIPTVCGMCGPGGPGGGCGIYAFVKNGAFTKVAGMDNSPVNRGANVNLMYSVDKEKAYDPAPEAPYP